MQQFILMVNDLTEAREKLKPVNEYIAHNEVSATLVHVYLGDWDMEHAERLNADIAEVLPEALIVGMISCGEIFEGNLAPVNYLVVVSVFECTQIRMLTYPVHQGEECEAGRRISAAIDDCSDARAVELFATVNKFDPQLLLEHICYRNKKLPVFGAGLMGIAAEGKMATAFLFTRERQITAGAVLVIYRGENFHVHLEQVFGWKPMGLEMAATRAENCIIHEIDGKPASEVYQHYLQIPKMKNLLEQTLGFPLLTTDRGVPVMRVPDGCGEDGSLQFEAVVREGSKVRLTYGNLNEIFNEVDARREELRRFGPQAIFLYDCITRRMIWNLGVDQELFPFQRIAPTTGFFCEGEFKSTDNGLIVNHQCTLIAVGMREGPSREIPPLKKRMEEMKFFTDSSIMKRMGTFIQVTTAELEEANRQLSELNEDLNRVNAKLSYMAVTDELTQLCNRREIEHCIHEARKLARENKTTISMIMVDIDFFKKVNDTYGHAVGDIVLRETAALIRSCLKPAQGEIAGRWGGEEFLLLLPDTGLEDAAALAERIRQKVEAYEFEGAGHCTLSLGVTCTDGEEDEKQVFIRADDALYRAKEGGRNQVVAVEK